VPAYETTRPPDALPFEDFGRVRRQGFSRSGSRSQGGATDRGVASHALSIGMARADDGLGIALVKAPE
jgi:hypothetical protein